MKLIRYHYPHVAGRDALDRLVESGVPSLQRFSELLGASFGSVTDPQQALLDVYEDDKNIYARLELPGFTRDLIDLNLEDGVLSLRTVQAEATDEAEATYEMKRAISVPEVVDQAEISASYEDGVLTVLLPKKAAPLSSRIEVK